MSLITYEPRNGLDFLFDPEKYFENNFGWTRNVKVTEPRVNVLEREDSFLIHAAVPGMKNDDIDIEVRDNKLTLSGRANDENKEETEEYRTKEFSQMSFQRAFQIGQWIGQDGITAKVENGILEVYLPKKEAVKPKKVKIN